MTPAALANWINAANDALDQLDDTPTRWALDFIDDGNSFIDRVVDFAVETWGLDGDGYKAFFGSVLDNEDLPRPFKPVDWSLAPPEGTYAFTAWLMAQGGDEDERNFWDSWKDEMKDASC